MHILALRRGHTAPAHHVDVSESEIHVREHIEITL